MSIQNKKKTFAIGAVIGAVAGVVTGILFAPKSGKETRKDIKNAAIKTAQKVHDETEELVEKAKNMTGKTASKAKEYSADAKKKALHLKDVMVAFKKGNASDSDLNDAVKKAREAQKSLITFIKK